MMAGIRVFACPKVLTREIRAGGLGAPHNHLASKGREKLV